MKQTFNDIILSVSSIGGHEDPSTYLNELLDKDTDNGLIYKGIFDAIEEHKDLFWSEGHRKDICRWLRKGNIPHTDIDLIWLNKDFIITPFTVHYSKGIDKIATPYECPSLTKFLNDAYIYTLYQKELKNKKGGKKAKEIAIKKFNKERVIKILEYCESMKNIDKQIANLPKSLPNSSLKSNYYLMHELKYELEYYGVKDNVFEKGFSFDNWKFENIYCCVCKRNHSETGLGEIINYQSGSVVSSMKVKDILYFYIKLFSGSYCCVVERDLEPQYELIEGSLTRCFTKYR